MISHDHHTELVPFLIFTYIYGFHVGNYACSIDPMGMTYRPKQPVYKCREMVKKHIFQVKIHPGRLTAGSPTAITHEQKGKWSEPNLLDYVPC